MKLNAAEIFARNTRLIIKSKKDKDVFVNTTRKINNIESSDLLEIKWVWEKTISYLMDNWIRTQEDIIRLWKEWIWRLKVSPIINKELLRFLSTNTQKINNE